VRREAAVEQGAASRASRVGAELRERRHFAVTARVSPLDLAGDLFSSPWSAPTIRRGDTDRPTFNAGRMPWKNRSLSR